MIPAYGTLITILLCVTIPPLLDRMNNNSEKWSRQRAFIAYGMITVFVLIVPIMTNAKQPILLLMLVLAVAVSALIGPLTYFGTTFVLLLSTVVLPILILWEITRFQGIKEPMKFVLKAMEWHEMVIPVALGLLTQLVTKNIKQRFQSRKEHS